jgi:hypothetical protein
MEKLASHFEDSANNPLDLYENLEMKMKVQLLESALVGAKKLMVEKEAGLCRRNENDMDLKQSEEMMHKSNKERASSMKVVVLGCGVAPANGVYICNSDSHTSMGNDACGPDKHKNAIAFEKPAVWKQQQVTFVLYPTTSGHYTQYKLAVRQQQQNTKDRTKVLYNSPMILGGGVIPEQAWEVEEDSIEGLHPPPQFMGRVEQPMTRSKKV